MIRVALVHDWLTGMRGGERVLEQLIRMLPQAEIFTLLHVPGSVSQLIEKQTIHASALSTLPGARSWYRHALPLFPTLIEGFDLSGFDLIVSSSHCVALGARVPSGVPHVCYCHSPMRYLYDQAGWYARRMRLPTRAALAAVRPSLRRWDRASAQRVTRFVANSAHVQARIQTHYSCDATVIHPPVEVQRFSASADRDDYYVTIAALVPYKRLDHVVRAFNTLKRRLIVIGDGPERRALQRQAQRNISFTGWIDDAQVAAILSRARGFVHAGVEDFGIALVEAQAAGAPVIALNQGGAREIVQHGTTGILYDEPNAAGLAHAVLAAETQTFSPATLRLHAMRFGPDRFRQEMHEQLGTVPLIETLFEQQRPVMA